MKTQVEFILARGEKILAELQADKRWHVIAWKVFVGLVNIAVLTLLAYTFLSPPLQDFLNNFLSDEVVIGILSILILGIIPMLIAAWVTDDLLQVYKGKIILTNQRMWIRSLPSSWSQTEIPFEDISSMTHRRDAIFLRRKGTRKIHVYPVMDAQIIVDAYYEHLAKDAED